MPLARTTVLERIHEILKVYADVVKTNVSSGRTDILIDAESTFCSLLNIIYNFDLNRPQQFTRNYPAVDLIDQDHRVAVQITSTNTRQKAQHTADSFMRHGFHQQFDTLIILILAYAPTFRNADQLSKKMQAEGINLRVITLLDLTTEIASLPQRQIVRVAEYLEKNIGFDDASKQIEEISIAAPSVSIEELTNICLQVFHLATLLPKMGLERIVFEHGLSPEQKHALIDLCDCSLLLKEGTVVKIHPYYQNSIACIPTPNECAFFLNRLWNYEESLHWDKLTWRQKKQVRHSLAQIFAKASELFPASSAVYAQQSAELWRSTQDYLKALQLEQKALEILAPIEKDSWNVARALHFTGDCHFRLKDTDLALVDWKRTLELCRNPLHASDTDLATAYHNVGRALIELEEYEQAKSFLLIALKIMEAHRRKDRPFLSAPWMESIYSSLATVYTATNNIHYASLCTQNVLRSPATQENLWEVFVPLHLPLPQGLPADRFIGREKELVEIAEQFHIKKVVYLSGYGGIGKTELAIQFGKLYKEGTLYFIRFHENLAKTIAMGISADIDNLSAKTPEDAYRAIMDRLARCSKKDILIIDEVVYSPNSLRKDPVWQELMHLPLRFLITTRYSTPFALRVDSMTNESLYRLFINQGLELNIDQMNALISAVNGHTLTVDLIARTLRRTPSLTPGNLLNILKMSRLQKEENTKMSVEFSAKVEDEQAQIYLRTLFDMARLYDSEILLLRNMVLLPEKGMDIAILEATLEQNDMETIGQLINRGLLSFDIERSFITIHPIIRLICLEELRPDDADCKDFLDAIWTQYSPTKYHSEAFQQYAELFSKAADTLPDKMGNWSFRAATFMSMLGQTQETLRYELQAASRQEQSMPASETLATTYSNLGLTYGELGNHQKALEYQLKALKIREAALSPDDFALANSYNNLGHSYGNLGNHHRALEYILRALNICEKVFPDDHPDLALSYYNAGVTYSDLGDYGKGLEYQLKALEIRQKVLPESHPELALSLTGVGTAYSDLGDHNKALDYKLKALAIQEKVLPPDHPELAASYNNIGSTYDHLGDHQKVLEYTMKAMAILERVLPPDHPDFATSLNNLAATYSALGDFRKALEYHLKSLSIFEKVLPSDHPHLATAYNNVGYTYGELGQYPQALDYIKKSLSIFEKSLPKGHPDIERTRKAVSTYQMMVNMSNSGFNFSDPRASKIPGNLST